MGIPPHTECTNPNCETNDLVYVSAEDHVDYAGSTIAVTWPRETFQPIEFHTFTLGPFTMSGTILRGETPEQAHARVMRLLERMAADLFPEKLDAFLDRIDKVQQIVRRRAKGG